VVLGSSSGLGWAVAEALGAEGANVVIVGRRRDLSEERAAALPSAIAVSVDVSEPGAAERVVARTSESFGDIDILVLNGGGPKPGQAESMGAEDVESATRLLVSPHVAMVNAVLPGMRSRSWGRIIAVGSSGVKQPIPTLAASNVGRAALAGYLKSLANDVAAEGVTVNMVLPGRIDTDRVGSLDAAAADRSGQTLEEVRRASEASIPAGRYGRPEEFAAAVAFLASAQASYVTGEQIRCDGGMVRAF